MAQKYAEGTIARRRVVQERRGLRVNNLYYWADTLREVIGRQILLRHDPRDLSTITARVGRQWIECKAQWLPEETGSSEAELQEYFKTLSVWRRQSKEAVKNGLNSWI
jgi:hypothetical protein